MLKVLKNILSSSFYMPGVGWEILSCVHPAMIAFLCFPNALLSAQLLLSPVFSFLALFSAFSISVPASQDLESIKTLISEEPLALAWLDEAKESFSG